MSWIIGLSGYARSGKDTVGQILVEDHGFTRIAFADKLKALALRMNPVLPLDCEGFTTFERLATIVEIYGGLDNAKLEVPAVREYLQQLGENVRRELGLDTWVEAAFRGEIPPRVVVTDCRYPNEASWIGMEGGFNLRVYRPGVGPANGHVSEHALDDFEFDYGLHNIGTIDDLRIEVARCLDYLGVA